jgi:hypothetical protein
MSLVRAWMRALSGASGAALLVPGGVFAAMVLLALAGSFGQLGQLGQALAGPAAPSVAKVASVSVPRGRAALLPVVSASAPTLATTAVPTGATGGTVVTPTPGGGSTPGRPPGPPNPAPPGPPRTNPTPTPTGCGSACNQTAPKPTAIDQVVTLGTSITSTVPGPFGPLATQTLKQVGATVDQLIPSNAHGRLAHVGSAVAQLKLP